MKVIKTNIDQEIIQEEWKQVEWKDRRDGNANIRLNRFLKRKYRIDLIELNESDLSKIILPEHAHDYIKCNSEISLNELRRRFEEKLPTSNKEDVCASRISYILNHFDSMSFKSKFLRGEFMFITKNLELSVKSSYQNIGYYTGSFHQFAAYALWIVLNLYMPLRLYLIE